MSVTESLDNNMRQCGVLTLPHPVSTLDHGIGTDAATLRHEGYTMRDRLLNTISNTVDRQKPCATFADGSSVPIWIVPHR